MSRARQRLAAPPSLAPLLLCACAPLAGCVTSLPRYDEPARIEGVALGARDGDADLVVLDVVWSVLPADEEHILLVIPREAGAPLELQLKPSGPTEPLEPGFEPSGTPEQRRRDLFLERDIRRWNAERRAREDLLMPDDLPPDARRTYALRNVRRGDERIELVVERRRGDAREEAGRIELPSKMTPRSMSSGTKWLLGVPLAVVDVAWVPVSIASFVLLLPFGSYAMLDASDDAR